LGRSGRLKTIAAALNLNIAYQPPMTDGFDITSLAACRDGNRVGL
jgi:hypothetical protein